MNSLHRLLCWLFRYEDLSPNADESYMLRWTLFDAFGRKAYLHKILATDWAREPHDHPKDFVSIGLSGQYVEEIYAVVDCGRMTPNYEQPKKLVLKDEVEYRAPWYRTFPAEHIHRLRVEPGEHCWTICITGKQRRQWGFWMKDGTHLPYMEFMKLKYGWMERR